AAAIRVRSGPVLSDIDREAEIVRVNRAGRLQRIRRRQFPVHVAVNTAAAAEGDRDVVPSAIADNGRGRVAHLGAASAGHVDAVIAATLSEYPPTPVVAAVPVLVGNERRIIDLVGVVGPEGDAETRGIAELQLAGIPQRHIVDFRTVFLRSHRNGAGAYFSGHKRGTWCALG